MTDAEFVIWAKREAPGRRVLVEIDFAYEAGGVMREGTVYTADGEYATRHDDAPPSTIYRACVSKIADIEHAIDTATLSGQADVSVGNIEFDNHGGELDFMLRLIVDGRASRVYVGDVTWPRRDFRLVGVMVSRRFIGAGEKRITLEASDGVGIVDAAVQGEIIATGPEAGQTNPLAWGSIWNMTPRLLDATALTYQVVENFDASTFVYEVRDKGGSLGNITDAALFSGDNSAITANAGTDKINFAGHGLSDNQVVLIQTTGTVFAGLTANVKKWVVGVVGDDFGLSDTRGGALIDITGTAFSGTMFFSRFKYMDTTSTDGKIQLSTDPIGQITVDFTRKNETTPFTLARQLLNAYAPTANCEADYFTAADAALDTRYGGAKALSGILISSRENLVRVLDELLAPLGGWYGQDYDGVYRSGLVDPSNLQAAAHTRTLSRLQIDDSYTLENLPIPFGGIAVRGQRNWTVQTDGLLDSLSADGKAIFAQGYRETYKAGSGYDTPAATYLPDWWANHTTAIPLTRTSYLSKQQIPTGGGTILVANQEVADALLADAKPWRMLLTVTIGLEAFDWRLGEVVRVTLPRFGFEGGWNFRIIRRRLDVMKGRLTFGLITQVTPDYTSASHP